MIDDSKTKPGNAKRPAPGKTAKAAKAVAAPKPVATAGKTPDFVKAVPAAAAPARNPLKPKPATPVVPVERVRPTETKAEPAASAPASVAAPPAPVAAKPEPVKPEPAAVPAKPSAEPAKPASVVAGAKPAPAPKVEKPAPARRPTAPAPKPVVAAPPAPAPAPAPAAPAKAEPVAAKSVPEPVKPAPVAAAAKPTPKPAAKPASTEIIDIPAAFEAFRKPADALGEELPKTFKTLATTGLDQTREAYVRMRRSAEQLNAGFENGAKTTQKGLHELQTRWFEAVRSQTDATLGFMKAMTEVRTLSDAIELNAKHARKRFEDVSAQAKDFAAVANRTLVEAGETVRKAVTESIAPRG